MSAFYVFEGSLLSVFIRFYMQLYPIAFRLQRFR